MHTLLISSWVSAGHVGLSAAAPALMLLGHEVMQVPTIILSNHPGFPQTSAHPVSPKDMEGLLDAIDANGWLDTCNAVLTGYMPSAEHAETAADFIRGIRQTGDPPAVVVDPVIGDEPGGLYVGEDAAAAVRDRLLPLADVVTPNRFELEWLSGQNTQSIQDAARAAFALADRHSVRDVHVTSTPVSSNQTGVLSVGQDASLLYPVKRYDGVPHGVGDVFSALIAAGEPVGSAVGQLDVLIRESLDKPHLQIAESARRWLAAPAVSGTPFRS